MHCRSSYSACCCHFKRRSNVKCGREPYSQACLHLVVNRYLCHILPCEQVKIHCLQASYYQDEPC